MGGRRLVIAVLSGAAQCAVEEAEGEGGGEDESGDGDWDESGGE